MAKALQCPSCGRRHRVSGLPDAPMFRCEGCGQRLKVPDQFRPSVMTSARYIRVMAIAPVWALFTTLVLSLFLGGARALARRRAKKRAEVDGSRRGARRG